MRAAAFLRKETILNALRFALGINSGKKIFVCFSEKSADFSEKLFHGRGCNAVVLYDPFCEKGIAERPQTLRYSEIKNNFSAEDGQSARGGHFDRPTCKKLTFSGGCPSRWRWWPAYRACTTWPLRRPAIPPASALLPAAYRTGRWSGSLPCRSPGTAR